MITRHRIDCACMACDHIRLYDGVSDHIAKVRLAEENERLRRLLLEQRKETLFENVALVTFAGLAFAAGVIEGAMELVASARRYRRRIFGGRPRP